MRVVLFHLLQDMRKDFTNGATDEELRIFEEVYEYSKKLLDKKKK